MINIYSISGEILLSVPVLSTAVSHEELMTSDYVQLEWESDSRVVIPAGSYIEHEGERYALLEPYVPVMKNDVVSRYSPQFQSRIVRWQKAFVPVYTYENDGETVKTRELDWTFVGTPSDAMFMVQQALRHETGEEWNFEVADGLPSSITLSAQSATVWSVLSEIAEQCETEWWAKKSANYLYLSKCLHGVSATLEVGRNVKVPSVSQATENAYYTRFYAFGSTRNVTQSDSVIQNSIVKKRLTLDPKTYPMGYKDIKGHYENGVFVSDLLPEEVYPTSLYFDDIYPSSSLKIGGVRKRMRYYLDDNGDRIRKGGTDEDPIYDQYAIWYFQIPNFAFTEELIIENQTLSVAFKSGKLRGREFELTYHSKGMKVADAADVDKDFSVAEGEYEIIMDDSVEGFIIPDEGYLIPEDGDDVVLFNIEMPSEYTDSAMLELEARLDEEIAERLKDNNSYEFNSNPIAFYEDDTNVVLGQAVRFINGGAELDTRVLMIEKHLDFPFEQKIRVGNELIKSSRQQLREEVENVTEDVVRLRELQSASSVARRDQAHELMLQMGRYYALRDSLEMLEGAVEGFTAGITPLTVNTMGILVGGNENLQFKFVRSRQDLTPVLPSPLVYDPVAKQLNANACTLIHMTMGLPKEISSSYPIDEYKMWEMETWHGDILEDATKAYYVYAKVETRSNNGTYELTEKPMQMNTSDFYYLLVGILNAEYSGTRELVTFYGFTEILPGQISTDLIRSADGKTYFDLTNGRIGGNISFVTSEGYTESMADFADYQSGVNQRVQDQIDGVVENWNAKAKPTTSNYPAVDWVEDADKIMHINDTYVDIEEYIDDEQTPDAGKAWRWCQCGEDIESEILAIDMPSGTSEMTYVGQIPVKNYGSIRVYRRGQLVTYIKNFAYDTDMSVDSGPPAKIMVHGYSGAVYITDMGDFLAGNITVYFYVDATLASDNNGNLLALHWHPIADSDAVRALKKVADVEYLKDTFSKGETNISGGVVMTNMVAVKDGASTDIEAFLNGSDFAKDEEHKKLIVAAGIPDGDDNLDVRAKEAATRIYEDGTIDTKMLLAKGGKIGGLFLEGGRLFCKDDFGNTVIEISPDSTILNSLPAYYGRLQRQAILSGASDAQNANSAFRISLAGLSTEEPPTAQTLLLIDGGSQFDGNAIALARGMVAGLRPRCEYVGDGQTYRCSSYDHTLISNAETGYVNRIYLPENPQDGQEIKIWKNNAHTLHIQTSDSRNIVRMKVGSQSSWGIDPAFFGTIDLIYHSVLGVWLMLIHETY